MIEFERACLPRAGIFLMNGIFRIGKEFRVMSPACKKPLLFPRPALAFSNTRKYDVAQIISLSQIHDLLIYMLRYPKLWILRAGFIIK
jgi:hypothetical protein